jgi:HEPN domain-containing protein
MLESDETRAVVREWVEKAENDLLNAAHTLRLGEKCPTDTACFHAQQCVEKYLKALLVYGGTEFPKTHSMAALLALLPKPARPQLTIDEQSRLTDYATVTRYPGDYEPIPLLESRKAVALARRVRAFVRKMLPRGTLTPKRK